MDFTLTGLEAQSFVAGLQRDLDESERTGSGLTLDANTGNTSKVGDWQPLSNEA